MHKLLLVWLFMLSVNVVHGAELIVSAAASLTNAFTELGKAFNQSESGNSVLMNFGGSGQLLQQIDRGAPVDVFATADQETMDRAQGKGLINVNSRTDFVRNSLVLIAPEDATFTVNTLIDLRNQRIRRIAVSNPGSVPVGRYSKLVLEAAGLWNELSPRFINTQHVRQSLDYVARGEVDIGFVYATDARAMPGKVKVLRTVPTKTPIRYPVAIVADSRNPDLASWFINFVMSQQGQAILMKHGFVKP